MRASGATLGHFSRIAEHALAPLEQKADTHPDCAVAKPQSGPDRGRAWRLEGHGIWRGVSLAREGHTVIAEVALAASVKTAADEAESKRHLAAAHDEAVQADRTRRDAMSLAARRTRMVLRRACRRSAALLHRPSAAGRKGVRLASGTTAMCRARMQSRLDRVRISGGRSIARHRARARVRFPGKRPGPCTARSIVSGGFGTCL